MKQLERGPTHGPNLLDAVLSTNANETSVMLTPYIADHTGTLTTIKVATPREMPVTRNVWDFRKANWTTLKDE